MEVGEPLVEIRSPYHVGPKNRDQAGGECLYSLSHHTNSNKTFFRKQKPVATRPYDTECAHVPAWCVSVSVCVLYLDILSVGDARLAEELRKAVSCWVKRLERREAG